MKADFVVCGTQKGGTSALDSYLRDCADICMADNKEVHFFDNEEMFANNSPDYSLYHSVFSPGDQHRIIGETTPIYMYWYEAPRRMWQYNPGMKLIVTLRNPIERAYSHWNMERLRGAETSSFWDAITHERERCRKGLPYQHRVYSYVDRGFYLEQLRRLWTYFPREQVLVLKTEELRYSPLHTITRVCRFLGVSDPRDDIGFKDVFSLPYDDLMTLNERTYVQSIYEFEIRALERVLEWNLGDWLLG